MSSNRHTPPAGRRLSSFGPVGLVAIATLVALTAWLVLPAGQVIDLMSETGPIEALSAWGFLLAAVAPWWLHPPRAPLRLLLALSVMLLAFGLRELDWHKVWTGTSMLRVSFYYGPAPLLQKLVSLAALATIAGAALWLLRHTTRPAWRAWTERRPAAVALAMFLVLMAASKVVDRSLNLVFEWSNWAAPQGLIALQLAIEETWELALPVLALLALLRWRSADQFTPRSTNTVSTPV